MQLSLFQTTRPPPRVNSTLATQVTMLLPSPAACCFITMVKVKVSQHRKQIIQCLSDTQVCPRVGAGVCVPVSEWQIETRPVEGE